eukprot:TRINITY_DN778_c0_g1_i4.p1 TRINITY_DN778_c0_g1~~TRINITY_DN778_c0_g1_i4.p1  ORF type:complete len:237 (-),score=23.36 TRINITY_DN778_c0_g1_i4:395-1105(-)
MSGASVLAGEPETKSRANGGVRITDVFVNWYHPTGHGITIHVHGSKEVAMVTPKKLFVTVMGDIWNTIPGPIAFIARSSFLPLELNSSYCNIEDSNNFLAGGNGQLTINIGNKENGTFGVLHATILNTLADLIAKGDAPFVLRFTDENDTVCYCQNKRKIEQEEVKKNKTKQRQKQTKPNNLLFQVVFDIITRPSILRNILLHNLSEDARYFGPYVVPNHGTSFLFFHEYSDLIFS